MICLSKADESTFRHLDFNQSPPPLSASHTTCQDLNGMANLREHVAADQEDGGGGTGGGPFATGAANQKIRGEAHSPWPAETLNAGRWAAFSSLRSSAASGGTDQKNRNLCPSSNNRSRIWSWISWILSVLVTAVAVSHHNSKLSPAPLQQPVSQPVVSPAANTLTKRATCATGGADPDEYNLPFHVGALFIILTVSFLGCAFPILAAKIPGLRIPGRFFFIVRHFGTGVLIATAFVHLLPTAFTSLGNPCLGDFWTKDYPAMPGAIALAAVFLVTVIEMVFHPSRHVPPASIVSNRGVGCMSNMAMELTSTGKDCCPSGISHPVRDMGPLAGRASSMAQGLSDLDRSSSAARDAIAEQARTGQPAKEEFGVSTDSESDVQVLTSEQQLRKDRLQCILLEMGILFHSVFIGMALSVSTGNEFIILLIAIVFHRKSMSTWRYTII